MCMQVRNHFFKKIGEFVIGSLTAVNIFYKNKAFLPIYRFASRDCEREELDFRMLYNDVFPAVDGSNSTIPQQYSFERQRPSLSWQGFGVFRSKKSLVVNVPQRL